MKGRWYTTSDVAGLLGVNVRTVLRHVASGLLPKPVRTLGGHRRWDPQAIDRLVPAVVEVERLIGRVGL